MVLDRTGQLRANCASIQIVRNIQKADILTVVRV